MQATFFCQFQHRALALNGLECHTSLKLRVMVSTFPCMPISPLLEISRRQIVAPGKVPF